MEKVVQRNNESLYSLKFIEVVLQFETAAFHAEVWN